MPIGLGAFLFGLIPFNADPAAVSAPFSHDRTLVGVSMLIAVAACFAFLELASRCRAHRSAAGAIWTAAAGAMLGACIWATHFVGMLALQSPLKHGFLLVPTTVSAAAGILCGGLAFMLAGPRPGWRTLILAGACVGFGGVAMHYLGMHGLRIEAALTYRPLPVAATSFGAFAGSAAAFWLAHRVESAWLRAVVSFPMGAVTAGLHYTDIAATIIAPRPAFAPSPAAIPDATIASAVVAAMAVLILMALVAVALDRRRGVRDAWAPAAPGEAWAAAESDVVIIPDPSPPSSADTIVLAPDRAARER